MTFTKATSISVTLHDVVENSVVVLCFVIVGPISPLYPFIYM